VGKKGFAPFERHFIDVLNGKTGAQPSGAHNLGTMALSLASYESAATGRLIRMKDWREGGHG